MSEPTTEELIGTLVNTVREYDIENYPTAHKALLAHYAEMSKTCAEAMDLADLQAARIAELEAENAELLEACKAALKDDDQIYAEGGYGLTEKAVDLLRSAIAKSEGKEGMIDGKHN